MNPNEMAANELTANGFHFALLVLNSLEVKTDSTAIMVRLGEVALGQVTLLNNLTEELAELETNRGRAPRPEERAAIEAVLSQRSSIDLSNQQTAQRILSIMAQEG